MYTIYILVSLITSREDHENRRDMDKYEGYAVDLINRLGEIMRFTPEFDIVDETGTYNKETKEWSGLIRKLIDNVSYKKS